jgi:hypothetical protein
MAKVLKIILWLAVLAIVAFLVFGGAKKEVVAPTPEMTSGVGGERFETGENIDTEQIVTPQEEVNIESSTEVDVSSTVVPAGE